jgi:hypothetical protein
MARLWDKHGFINYLRNRLQGSAYDADDRPAAFELLKRAQASGQAACNSNHLDEAVHHLSLALAILFDTGGVDTP